MTAPIDVKFTPTDISSFPTPSVGGWAASEEQEWKLPGSGWLSRCGRSVPASPVWHSSLIWPGQRGDHLQVGYCNVCPNEEFRWTLNYFKGEIFPLFFSLFVHMNWITYYLFILIEWSMLLNTSSPAIQSWRWWMLSGTRAPLKTIT